MSSLSKFIVFLFSETFVLARILLFFPTLVILNIQMTRTVFEK